MSLLGWLVALAVLWSAPAPAPPQPDLEGLERAVATALVDAREGVTADPGSPEAWGRLGSVLQVHGFHGPAAACYEQAVDLDPEEFRWAYFLARARELDGASPDEFIALYERAVALGPGYAPARVRLGLARSTSGQLDEARDELSRAVAIDPGLAIAQRSFGEVLLALGDAAAAVVPLQRAAELAPQDAAVYSALARAYRQLGEDDLARSAAESAAHSREYPAIPDPLLDTEVRALGVSSRHRFERAQAMLALGDAAEALVELAAVSDVRPDDADVRYLEGVALGLLGRDDEAMRSLAKAIAIDPDHVRARVELGRLLEARGRLDEAIEQYRRSHMISPRDPAVLVRLSAALAESGDLAGLIDAYRALGEAVPDDPRIPVNLGTAYLRSGDADAAVRAFGAALDIDPGLADAHYRLGVAYEILGRPEDEVLEQFTEAASLDPDHAAARQRLAEAGMAPDPSDPKIVREEFERIAERLYDGDNTYLGRARVRDLREGSTQPGLDPRSEIDLRLELASRLLEAGEVDDAVAEVERVTALASALPPQGNAEIAAAVLLARGVAYLRLAEVQNCVARHNPDCCILPFREGGIHADKAPAAEAAKSFGQLLDLRPDDLRARWLLNVTAMALGSYPGSVPEGRRLPPAAFDSDYDIGRFRDVAPALAVDTFDLCGGAVVEDIDRDGLLDIVTSTFDPEGPISYYRNDGEGGFEDRSVESGLAYQLGGLNTVAADYDNDGDVDILVLRGAWLFDDGRIRNSLLRNDGHGGFTDVTRRAGLAEPAYPTQAAAWGDYDLDGDLDLYVCNESRKYLASRADYPSQLFSNEGDGTFTDVARQAGATNDRYCKGVTAGDYDNDGDLDLYVSNLQANRLYRNRGNGTFEDVALEAGVTEPAGRSFATWFFDYDNDGDLDLFVAGYRTGVADLAAQALGLPHSAELPRLYRNRGDGSFENVTAAVGLDHAYLPMGANFGDLDNDGWLDVYLATGDPSFETLMPNVMLRNDRARRFQDVTASGGFGHLQKGHGVAFADIDNDGDQDVYNQLGGFFPGDRFRNALFENPGHGNRWIVIETIGTASHRGGYGARIRVTVETPDGPRSIHRAVGSVSSFGGSPARQEIGLGNATRIVSVEVTWPKSRTSQIFADVALDTRIRVTEGSDLLERVELESLTLGSKP